MNNITERVDNYIHHLMSEEERAVFEQELAADPSLRDAVAAQQKIYTAIEYAGLREAFSTSLSHHMRIRRIRKWSIAGGVVITVALVVAIATGFFNSRTKKIKGQPDPKSELFSIDNDKDTIIESKEGVVFLIPSKAFGGKQVNVEIKTALNPADIVRNGLSTESNGSLLQTAGMFYINGYRDGYELSLKKKIAVSVPSKERLAGMQLFKGEQKLNGLINWTDPVPVDYDLQTFDITQLNFYPPRYLPFLQTASKDFRNRRYTDSLYYSFSGYPFDGATMNKTVAAPANESDTSINEQQTRNGTVRSLPRVPYEINPARIGAFWNSKFNNTILATHEFEERMQFIFEAACYGGTGNAPERLLQLYVDHFYEKLYQIDERCAAISSGEVKEKFLAFANRKDGGVKVENKLYSQLATYYMKKKSAYENAAALAWDKAVDSKLLKDQYAEQRTSEQVEKEVRLASENFQREFCINLTNAYQQIGVVRTCNDTMPVSPLPPTSYDVMIESTGWYNLDKYVFDATTTRQSMSYTDPETGRTATLVYKEITINVANASKYDNIFAYVVPDSLSTFQRIIGEGGSFTGSLNMLFRHDAIVVGYRDSSMYYAMQPVGPGSYEVRLEHVSDKALNAALKRFARRKKADLSEEFNYQLLMQKEFFRQQEWERSLSFRNQVATIIFGCDLQPLSDTVKTIRLPATDSIIFSK